MAHICCVCNNNDAKFTKRVIDNWHYSGDLQVIYTPYYVCDNEACMSFWKMLDKYDRNLVKQLHIENEPK